MTDTEILKARARELARPLAQEKPDEQALDVVEFRLAHERYAVEQRYVREVHPLRELTPLPGVPAFYAGVINVRGQILPVIDIKKFFDLPETGITDLHVAVVVRAKDVDVGILADAVATVRTIGLSDIQPSLPTLTGIRAQYLKGVTPERLVILDVSKILADPKLVIDEEVEGARS